MKNLKGLNWFHLNQQNGLIQAKANEEVQFQIPLTSIASSAVINKNDLQIEFPFEEVKKEDDCLCEVRFYFPPQGIKDQEGSNEEKNEAEKMRDQIISQVQNTEFAGESIVTLEEIPLLVPRGKYTCDFYDKFLRFHGQTHNYKIDYKNVERAFLLPKPDEVHMFLVISLVKPLRQGNTVYPYLVIQMRKDVSDSFDLKLKQDQKSNFDENLQESYTGPVFDVLTKFLKLIGSLNRIIQYLSFQEQSGIRCSVKAQEGFLYPLQKSIIFVHKPVLYMRIDDIGLAIFHRIGGNSKLFDLELKRKSTQQSQLFTSIDKQELEGLKAFFKSKNVRFEIEDESKIQQQLQDINSDIDVSDDSRNEQQTKEKKNGAMQEEDSSADEDFVAEESESASDAGESDIDNDDL